MLISACMKKGINETYTGHVYMCGVCGGFLSQAGLQSLCRGLRSLSAVTQANIHKCLSLTVSCKNPGRSTTHHGYNRWISRVLCFVCMTTSPPKYKAERNKFICIHLFTSVVTEGEIIFRLGQTKCSFWAMTCNYPQEKTCTASSDVSQQRCSPTGSHVSASLDDKIKSRQMHTNALHCKKD